MAKSRKPVPGSPRPAGKRQKLGSINVSPADRLAASTKGQIDTLARDKRFYRNKVADLQRELDRLGPEVTRLREALDNAEANNVYATTLIALGGFLVSYAAFTGNLAPAWANASVGLLASGVGLLLWQAARRWRRGRDQTR